MKLTAYNNYIRLLKLSIRKISTQATPLRKNHYEALGISAKATQADVKSAYYKLSMIYHPDKNKDSEDAAKKFRDIREAYEVLGNVKSRKLYDRGLFFESATSSAYGESPMSKFYKSRETISRPPTAYGRTTVYDFDEWARSHYGATFQRDMRYRERQKFKQQRKAQTVEDVKSEKVILLIGVLILLAAFLSVDSDYDAPDSFTTFGATNVIVKSKTT